MQIIFESRYTDESEASRMRELSIDKVRFALRRLNTLVPRA